MMKPKSKPFLFMEIFRSSNLRFLFSRLLCLLLFSVHVLAQPYRPPDKYFVNCGSATNVLDDTGRIFIGDLNANDNFRFTSQNSRQVNHGNASVRIFYQPAFYEFEIEQDAVHIVRLYFSPSSFLNDLSAALFDVSAYGVFLLKDVNATNIGNDSVSIKEFFLELKKGKFHIIFSPKSSSIAYINAIEVFPTPPNFIQSEAQQIITEGRNDVPPKVLPVLILHTIYRVNMGGPKIFPSQDNLWRKWEQDDVYLLNSSSARDSNPYPTRPNYANEIDQYIAPDWVYRTAREMNINSSSLHNFNITWSFPLRKDTLHRLRVHFYDFIGITSNGFLAFNLYIGNNFSKKISSSIDKSGRNYPFHYDFSVDSGESGLVNVSVGPLGQNDTAQFTAFLNGVEIMEIMDEVSKDPVISEPWAEEKKNKHVGLLVGLTVGGFALVCILGCGIWFGLKWRKPKTEEASYTHTQWSPLSAFGGGSTHSRFTERTTSSSPIPNLNLGLKFSLAEIKTATYNFNKKFLVGEGGFGKVYKGVLRNGMNVAVKRSQPGAGQGISEFEREITILSKIRHRHLVSFIGYCDEGLEMILVYEFLEKGTLREHLYNSKFPPLPWKKRLEICIGAARGLHYLHKGSAGGIIHRDVKSTNILLDENLVAKVSDFGLSRAGPLDETHVSTDIKGTFGYLDPEYFRTQQLTEKSDVYSFGVLLLEVLCARPALNPTLPREQINLAEWGLRCKKMNLLEEIIDSKLEGQIDPNSLRKFSDTIEKCLQDDAANRPTMADVLWDLEYALQLQQSAHPRMPHEDSETNANGTSSTAIRRFPSFGSSVMRDDPDMSQNLDTHMTANEVFSQIKAGYGR